MILEGLTVLYFPFRVLSPKQLNMFTGTLVSALWERWM
jgi:hypothetical protein